jgi:hypothetical protein
MRKHLAAVAVIIATIHLPPAARAAVVVVANRAGKDVRFTARTPEEKPRQHVLAAGDLVVIPTRGDVLVSFDSEGATRELRLVPQSAYFFGENGKALRLLEIGLGSPVPESTSLAKKEADEPGTIPLKIVVDQDEPAVQRLWEARLRNRVAQASALLEKHCRIRLEVVEVGTWESAKDLVDLPDLLADLRKKVAPGKARLVLGFFGRRMVNPGRTHLGGTGIPLGTHILLRESLPRSEAERLEVLVHELGHFLGAAHSPEPNSVMRPRLGDKQAVRQGFRIGFDPVNTLAMNLVAEEFRARQIKGLDDVNRETAQRLGQIYETVARAMPDDPVPGIYLKLLDKKKESQPGQTAARFSPLEEATRTVLAALVRAAEDNQKLPERSTNPQGPCRRSGDDLAAYYVRAAAAAAQKLPAEQAVSAFLLGLGIGLDTSDLMRKTPLTGPTWKKIELDAERSQRLKVIGLPTMRGRHDLNQHFVVSGALTALAGATAAEKAGLLKELLDSRTDSGFSFADLSADLAGVTFAQRLFDEPARLARVAKGFTVADYLIPPKGLPEDLSQKEFARRYGSLIDERFLKLYEEIRQRVQALPGYKEEEKKKGDR